MEQAVAQPDRETVLGEGAGQSVRAASSVGPMPTTQLRYPCRIYRVARSGLPGQPWKVVVQHFEAEGAESWDGTGDAVEGFFSTEDDALAEARRLGDEFRAQKHPPGNAYVQDASGKTV